MTHSLAKCYRRRFVLLRNNTHVTYHADSLAVAIDIANCIVLQDPGAHQLPAHRIANLLFAKGTAACVGRTCVKCVCGQNGSYNASISVQTPI